MKTQITDKEIKDISNDIVSSKPLRISGQKQVFKCHLNNGNDTILKFVHIETLNNGVKHTDKTALERLMREIRLTNQITSPFLPKSGEIQADYLNVNDETYYYYSEECVQGEDLREHINKGSLDEKKVQKLVKDVASAIQVLWNSGRTIHRDIKPENIIFNENANSFVLIDAGLALTLYEVSITPSGYIVGTPPYMSPEQVQGKRRQLDFRSDLYALGIVAYEAITGNHPYWVPGMDRGELFNNILYMVPPTINSHSAIASNTTEEVIHKLLSKRPHSRYNSCEKVIQAIAV